MRPAGSAQPPPGSWVKPATRASPRHSPAWSVSRRSPCARALSPRSARSRQPPRKPARRANGGCLPASAKLAAAECGSSRSRSARPMDGNRSRSFPRSSSWRKKGRAWPATPWKNVAAPGALAVAFLFPRTADPAAAPLYQGALRALAWKRPSDLWSAIPYVASEREMQMTDAATGDLLHRGGNCAGGGCPHPVHLRPRSGNRSPPKSPGQDGLLRSLGRHSAGRPNRHRPRPGTPPLNRVWPAGDRPACRLPGARFLRPGLAHRRARDFPDCEFRAGEPVPDHQRDLPDRLHPRQRSRIRSNRHASDCWPGIRFATSLPAQAQPPSESGCSPKTVGAKPAFPFRRRNRQPRRPARARWPKRWRERRGSPWARRAPTSGRSGAVLYEMLAGKRAGDGAEAGARQGALAPRSLPHSPRTVLARALATVPVPQFAVSPDGRAIVFVASTAGGRVGFISPMAAISCTFLIRSCLSLPRVPDFWPARITKVSPP